MKDANRRQRLVILAAPSGAGKTTLCARLLQDFPLLVASTSTTTRAPRGEEIHGREYYFVSRSDFERQMAEGRFAEWASVHGHYYGTSKDVINRAFAAGKSVLLDIDVQGAESLRKAYPEQAWSIFISPPDLPTLERRLRARGTDSEETIVKRVENARREMLEAGKFHRVVVNDDLERAYRELKVLVEHEIGRHG